MALDKKRILWVDTFKAFMIIFVAFGHAVYEKEPVGYACNYYIHAFHVAGFFFVSGYLFGKNNNDFISLFKKKFKSLMIPYYIFAFVSVGIFILIGSIASAKLDIGIKTTDILKNIAGIFYANGLSGYMKWNLPMWFIPCLFISFLIFFFIIKIINLLEKKIGYNVANVAMISILLLFNVVNYYFIDIKYLPFGLEVAIYMLPIMVFGFWIKPYIDFDSMEKYVKLVLGIVFVAFGLLSSVFIGQSVSFVSSIYGNLFIFYTSCIFNIIGFMFLSSLINSKGLNYIGQNTLVILIIHKFPIVFMQLLFEKYMKDLWINNICLSVLITTISIVVSLICNRIITKFMPFVLGKSK